MKNFETESQIWFSEDWWIHPEIVSVSKNILDEEIIDFTEEDLYKNGINGFTNY
jgi:hypothetical protein